MARRHLPTPGNGGRPGKACCRVAASPFGKPWGGIVKCSGSARNGLVEEGQLSNREYKIKHTKRHKKAQCENKKFSLK